MSKLLNIILLSLFGCFCLPSKAWAQLSPGDLSKAHSHLEGVSNCTQCHVLRVKETSSKCLTCHKEIKKLIDQKKGYHASKEVNGKKCASCHNEHMGLDYNISPIDTGNFNHELTGFKLEGKHAEVKCMDCHKPTYIHTKLSQKKGSSFLGLETRCLACHDDFHQGTLDKDCLKCHNQTGFSPAPKFNHAETDFKLVGAHQSVDCEKCHPITSRNGTKFQQFTDILHKTCTHCHEDIHNNKFGQDCLRCHTQNSFKTIKNRSAFDHSQTNFPLKGQHASLNCQQCHKEKLTDPLAHNHCYNCHTDYHNGEFTRNGQQKDCNACHTEKTFSPSTFDIERHNHYFALNGAHLATPCIDCHKSRENWTFKRTTTECTECHDNIHEGHISPQFLPDNNCQYCHNTNSWTEINFDHNQTEFRLLGVHQKTECRKCHFQNIEDVKTQVFYGLSQSCETCHTDVHQQQFAENGQTDCQRCHTFENWNPDKFDHNTARFKLDGAHAEVACAECHKPNSTSKTKFITYKFKDISCANCH